MKKTIVLVLVALMAVASLAGCNSGTTDGTISVISREEGSGTRGAFVELMGIEQKDAEGNKVDYTSVDADITNNTSVMMTTVSGNVNAIGYISLGSLNDTVKAIMIDGAEATVENIKSGAYKVSRPFNIATYGKVNEATQAFIDFILSSDGQAIVEEAGYIKATENGAFAGSTVAGKIVVAGSSSVTPVMEKLREAYLVVNPNAEIEVQQSDSSNGMNSAIEGICDIGMASRELKDSEVEAGLTPTVIALDGIAIIVHKDSAVTNLTSEQVKNIFMGEITKWSEILG